MDTKKWNENKSKQINHTAINRKEKLGNTIKNKTFMVSNNKIFIKIEMRTGENINYKNKHEMKKNYIKRSPNFPDKIF